MGLELAYSKAFFAMNDPFFPYYFGQHNDIYKKTKKEPDF